jgi:hypothetical protein
MTDKSVFRHEPDSTKRHAAEEEDLYADSGKGRHRGKALTPEQREQERRSKGHRDGGPGREGEVEIADPDPDRGIQHGYGKNQDKESPEKMTPENRSLGAQEGRGQFRYR